MNKRIPLYLDTAAPGWMVQSDFDGTISLLDVTDTLLNRFGKPGWQELEDAWERGEIGSRECMKGQVALLDMSESELNLHARELRVSQLHLEEEEPPVPLGQIPEALAANGSPLGWTGAWKRSMTSVKTLPDASTRS